MPPEEPQTYTKQGLPIVRSEGVNASERYLKKLCDRSFLSLWSYSSVFRDQGRPGQKGDGKEICDLLVVFGNHVLIFSDKYCELKNTGNLQTDWSRWYRGAVLGGAKQIWGAERWIKKYPDRIFLDNNCTQPFPIRLPDPATAQYHRIIVAHGASEHCKQELGGSGSLMIGNNTVSDPIPSLANGEVPFTIGQVNPEKGFIHIFDDTTLDIVLQTLDTVSDFTAYLTKKERFFMSGSFGGAAGEEELLAEYLKKLNSQGEHDFVFPPNITKVYFDEGLWEEFQNNPQRLAQLEANEISYMWDALIEEFNKHQLAGTREHASHSLKEVELAIRFLASENRTKRRVLSQMLYDIIRRTPADKRAVRVIGAEHPDEAFYVLMLFPWHNDHSYERNREVRRNHLSHYCQVLKSKFPQAQHIVGIATESGLETEKSEDLIYLDARDWTEELQAKALELQKEFNILNNVNPYQTSVQEYPDGSALLQPIHNTMQQQDKPYISKRKPGPNKPCSCGSGIKYKFCCGKPRTHTRG